MIELAKYLIKKYEGLSLTPYKCPAGLWTIGYGHIIDNAEEITEIDLEFAEKLLENDYFLALRSVERLINVSLSESQIASLISFTFNLGGAALQRSTLRQKINRYEYLEAADEFLRWTYAAGRKLPGLIKRRAEERAIFLLNSAVFPIDKSLSAANITY